MSIAMEVHIHLVLLIIFVGISVISAVINIILMWKIFHTNKNTVTKVNAKDTAENFHLTSDFKLINLPTRHELISCLNETISHAKQNNKRIAIFLLDLDNFNNVNEHFGIIVGDMLLQQVAERIEEDMRQQSIIISYMGGDEYAVIIEIEQETETQELVKKAEHLQYVLYSPYLIMGHEIHTGVSIGICIYPDYADSAEKLLKFSAVARDEAKKIGKNTYSFYAAEMSKKVADTSFLGEALHRSIENQELFLVYQPKIDAKTGRVVSSEALVRWRHSERGIITPDVFIPIAEDIGMIMAIGGWIIETAAEDLRRLHLDGFDKLSVAINLSASQFSRGDVVGVIADILYETRLQPEFLEIELTESMVMHNPAKALLMLRVLKSMGIKVAMDDFGTGHSSLSHLKNMPVDILKIDQSFIKDMSKNNENHVIVSTIIGMAKKLGLKVVAEGVEKEEEVNILRAEGCDYLQGYYYSKPLEFADFKQYCIDNYTAIPAA